MAHQLVLFINLIGVILFDAFLIGDISITQNIPATMEPGSEIRVTVTVNKGDLKGFAKLQLDLPEGMTATAIETNGASFTFADQKAKFIWMALPATPTFKVSYTLSAAATATGNLPVLGRFSYIEDNERKTYDLPTTTVDLGSIASTPVVHEVPNPAAVAANAAAEVAQQVPPSPVVPTPAVTTPAVTPPVKAQPAVTSIPPPAKDPSTIASAVVTNASGTANSQGKGGITSERSVSAVTENEMLVEVKIEKGTVRGFGKLQEVIPAGFTAVEKSSADAIFTTQDRIVKFVWLNLPAESEIVVVYKLRANENPNGSYDIDGEFGYLLNDETQKSTIGTTNFKVGPDALIAAKQEIAQVTPTPKPVVTPDPPAKTVTPAVEPVVTPIEKPKPIVTPKTVEPVAKPAKTEMRPEVTPEPVVAQRSTIPSPEKGITFKVQITAAHKEVSNSYFKVLHKFSGQYSMERHQGWVKYVTGSFGAYKEARDQRNSYVQAGHKFPGPFVTAYNNGERITVQEALVLSNQKWSS